MPNALHPLANIPVCIIHLGDVGELILRLGKLAHLLQDIPQVVFQLLGPYLGNIALQCPFEGLGGLLQPAFLGE